MLFVDEATQQSEEKMEKLRACVRGVNDFPKRVYYTCNPGGEGHAWVKRLFIDRRFKEGEEPEDHSFIQSLINSIANYLCDLFMAKDEPAPEPEKKPLAFEEVRAILAQKARDGFKDQIKAILERHGSAKLHLPVARIITPGGFDIQERSCRQIRYKVYAFVANQEKKIDRAVFQYI